jgi:hypothetical protein
LVVEKLEMNRRTPIPIRTFDAPGLNSLTLNTATTFGAVSVPGDGRTLSEVRFYLSAVAGSVDGTEIHAMLYNSASLHPSTLVGSEDHTLAAGAVSAAGWYTITGFNTALAFGTHYWIVFKNTNAVPATNYPTLRTLYTEPTEMGTSFRGWCWMYRSATDNADPNLASWNTANNGSAAGVRFGFSNSSYDGFPISAGSGGLKSYGANKSGASFVAPATMTLIGVSMQFGRAGSPTGTASYELYEGATLLASTDSIVPSETNTSVYYTPLYFSTAQTLRKGVLYRIVLADSATDSASNYYYVVGALFDTDANSLALAPLGGTLKYASYSAGAGWSDSAATVVGVTLLVQDLARPLHLSRVYTGY